MLVVGVLTDCWYCKRTSSSGYTFTPSGISHIVNLMANVVYSVSIVIFSVFVVKSMYCVVVVSEKSGCMNRNTIYWVA